MNFKLKPLVASMALVASSAVLAAGFTPPEPAPVVVDRLDKALERNHNGRFAEPDWFRRITLSGELNVDLWASSRTPFVDGFTYNEDGEETGFESGARFGTEEQGYPFSRVRNSSSGITLADADVYIGAKINDWIMANVDFVYEDPGAYGSVNQDHIRNQDTLDEAYITLANFRESPFYLIAGREYVPYGLYVRHPITMPFTQLMTQTNATAAQVGVIDASGFNGAIFAFNNKVERSEQLFPDTLPDFYVPNGIHRIENGGAQIGFRQDYADWGFNLDASYLANLNDVDYQAESLFSQHDSVDGYSLVAQGHYMGFDGELQFTSAFDRFSPFDVCWKETCTDTTAGRSGAKPKAWLIGLGYSFPVYGHDSRFGINYQASRQAVDFGIAGIPKYRWQADYSVNLWKNTDITFEYVADKDYNVDDGGTDSSSDTGIIRLSTKFA